MLEKISIIVPFRRPEAEPLTWSGEIVRFAATWEAIAAPEPGGGDLNRPRPNWSRSDLIRFVLPVTVVLSSRHWLDWAPRFGVFTAIRTGVIVSIAALLLWGDLLYSCNFSLCEMLKFPIVSEFYNSLMAATLVMGVLLICERHRFI